EQSLARGATSAELLHDRLIEHPLVGGVLVHQDQAFGGLEQDEGVEDLQDRRREGAELGLAVDTRRRRVRRSQRQRQIRRRGRPFTNSWARLPVGPASAGRWTHPSTSTAPAAYCTGKRLAESSRPQTDAKRDAWS